MLSGQRNSFVKWENSLRRLAEDDAETCFTEALNYVAAYPRALTGLGPASKSDEEHDTVAQPALEDEESSDTEGHEDVSTSGEAVDGEQGEGETRQEPVLPETEQLSQLEHGGETGFSLQLKRLQTLVSKQCRTS